MIKSHTFRGRTYRIIPCDPDNPGGALGITDPPSEPDKMIVAPVDGDKLIDLQTLIHEALHASFWDLDERAVEEADEAIGRFLWRCGWRKTEEAR